MPGQGKGRPRGKGADVADAIPQRLLAGLGLHLDPGIDVAQRILAVVAGILVLFIALVAVVALGNRLDGGLVGLRCFKVVVAQGHLAAAHRLAASPFKDVVLGPPIARFAHLELYRRGARYRLMRAGTVDDGQHVLATSHGREIVHPFFLHQAADEGKVGLVVLHAVDARVWGAAGVDGVVGKPPVAEDLLDDVDRVHVLEDAVVRGLGQEPQPGPDLEREETVAFVQADKLGLDAGAHELAPGAAAPCGAAARAAARAAAA